MSIRYTGCDYEILGMLAEELSDTGFLSRDRGYRRIEAAQECGMRRDSPSLTGQITLW